MSIFVVESCDEASSGASAAAPWEHARERKRQHHHSPEATKLKARGRAVNSVRSCCRDFYQSHSPVCVPLLDRK